MCFLHRSLDVAPGRRQSRSLQAWIGKEFVGERVEGVWLLHLRGWGGVPGVPIRGERNVKEKSLDDV